jgi:ATP-dependent Clp protease ATP-binding subunit ClpB
VLSKKILAGDVDKTKPVLVDVFGNTVVFRNEIPELAKNGKKK